MPQLDLKASMVDLLDIDHLEWACRCAPRCSPPFDPRPPGPRQSERSPTCCRPLPRSPRRRGGPPTGSPTPSTGAPTGSISAADRWRTLYREALSELDSANVVLKKIGASEPAKRRARARIMEARAALDLLRGQVDDIVQGDFYTYRYFASEGFLPGYSFPRLPLAAFIPADRRTRTGPGDYVQRPRFLAISEFGPARSSTTKAPATKWTGSACPRARTAPG